MSKKIEKLKEINATLEIILSKLETRIFIDDIYGITDNKANEQHNVVLASK